MRRLLIIVAVFCSVTFAVVAGATARVSSHVTDADAQCRGTDRVIPKRVRFARGRTTAVIKDTVRLCTSHEYTLRARAGQMMSVHLATGNQTSFSVYSPSNPLEGADGVKDWEGELPDTGEYTISIGTDATARYTLEVTIR
ncbi:MAG TPA: hypothetical protein VFX96_04140 [Pyrinomonadaceae bacterium]|nr:hypothetical protein [Pyrinomonadaceae bacterium]